ncbi:hypothetical protein D1AOALGA4SA_10110 [Olavius algarvensis Delta 1 endosymbiont]|nr:hypothetical protein D1AOALGA4SA_10110 [Olavius algarvensis Delta 1 endosymbiont]
MISLVGNRKLQLCSTGFLKDEHRTSNIQRRTSIKEFCLS